MSILIYHKQEPGGGSDITLKKEITTLHHALFKVLALRPVTWRWKAKKDDTGRLQYGFIAQEVEEILPQLVSDGAWEDGTTRKFLSSDSIMPYLVGAIKEQQDQIQVLQAQIDRLTK